LKPDGNVQFYYATGGGPDRVFDMSYVRRSGRVEGDRLIADQAGDGAYHLDLKSDTQAVLTRVTRDGTRFTTDVNRAKGATP
jgi:hypothetical protein